MQPHIRNEIEAITANVLKLCGYYVDYAGEIKKISKSKMFYYKLLDGFNLFQFSVRNRGISEALRWSLAFFKIKR